MILERPCRKTLLVTGASQGIGLAVDTAAIAQGAQVAGVSRTISPDLKAIGAGQGFGA